MGDGAGLAAVVAGAVGEVDAGEGTQKFLEEDVGGAGDAAATEEDGGGGLVGAGGPGRGEVEGVGADGDKGGERGGFPGVVSCEDHWNC